MATNRRSLLQMAGAAAMGAALPESIGKALAIEADRREGTIKDIDHIVVLMQENRPFDQYFGTLNGVRGFNDPRAVTLPNGNSVFAQPTGNTAVLPFNPPDANPGLTFYQDVAHGWNDSHLAWNGGKYDAWIANKGRASMIYFKRSDIPFHYALADAFTVCDSYYCSVMGPTDPNRYYSWTGWLGQGGSNPDSPNSGATPGTFTLRPGGDGVLPFGPITDNAEEGYSWKSYPERLTQAGVTWKVYQDQGAGLTQAEFWGWGSNPYIGNFGDNSLLYLLQYQNAAPGSALFEGARRGTDIKSKGFDAAALFEDLRNDVMNNRLPQISFIAAPEAFSEHPNWPPNYGAWYISNVLSALTANPKVWARTVLFYTFDEAGGFFDHIVPPAPPSNAGQGKSTVSTVNEIYPGTALRIPGPYGLGTRVPMVIISPWSKGNWVCSEVFDHTSIIRFMEKRFGVLEPNISPWRRSVCGDLTSAFDFDEPNPHLGRLPSVAAYAVPQSDVASGKTFPNAALSVPAPGTMPVQENGPRLARALPYRLQADGKANNASRTFALTFGNAGSAGACFHVRSPDGSSAGGTTGPWSYTVEAGKSLSDIWTPIGDGSYSLTVNGPNGFFRAFSGNLGTGAIDLTVTATYDASGITLHITNNMAAAVPVDVTDTYSGDVRSKHLAPGATAGLHFWLSPTHNWYDLIVTTSEDPDFVRQYAGHVENGAPSASDPKLGKATIVHGHHGEDHPDGHRPENREAEPVERVRGRASTK